jgi:hypothetical protein
MPLLPPAAKIPLPIQETLRDLFVDLLGKGAEATRGKELKVGRPGSGPALIVATWVDKFDRVGAVCIAELPIAAMVSAALVMAPPSRATDAVTAGALDDDLRENFHEVVNVLTTVLNTPTTPHLKLDRMFQYPAEDLPADVRRVVETPSSRRDFELAIDGYGKGRISLLC